MLVYEIVNNMSGHWLYGYIYKIESKLILRIFINAIIFSDKFNW